MLVCLLYFPVGSWDSRTDEKEEDSHPQCSCSFGHLSGDCSLIGIRTSQGSPRSPASHLEGCFWHAGNQCSEHQSGSAPPGTPAALSAWESWEPVHEAATPAGLCVSQRLPTSLLLLLSFFFFFFSFFKYIFY